MYVCCVPIRKTEDRDHQDSVFTKDAFSSFLYPDAAYLYETTMGFSRSDIEQATKASSKSSSRGGGDDQNSKASSKKKSKRTDQEQHRATVELSEHQEPEAPQDHDDKNEEIATKSCWSCQSVTLALALLMGFLGMVLGSAAYSNVQSLRASGLVTSTTGTVVGSGGQDTTANTDPNGEDSEAAKVSTLDKILERGTLNCGLPFDNTPGFLMQNQGMDVELCKAISAAIFGNPMRYTPVPIPSGDDRWTYLQGEQVDVVLRSTHTLERDVFVETTGTGFEFSPPYFYDGLMFGGIPPFVKCAEQTNTTGVCANLRICAVAGTTHLDVVREMFVDRHIRPRPNLDALYSGLMDETCNVLAWELNGVSENVVRMQSNYQGLYEIGTKLFSREPLAIVTREDDPEFTDMIFWIIQALQAAEEKGITQANAGDFATTELFGPSMESIFQNVIAGVGNYGEIYA